jgi:hypothetical protein
MTQQDFLNKIEGTVNDLDNRLMTKQEAMNHLLQHFLDALKSVETMKEAFATIVYQCWKMRQLQNQYFTGDKTVLGASKNIERIVDDKLAAYMKRPGFTAQELIDKYEPKKTILIMSKFELIDWLKHRIEVLENQAEELIQELGDNESADHKLAKVEAYQEVIDLINNRLTAG